MSVFRRTRSVRSRVYALALWTAALVITAGAILTRATWCGAQDAPPAPTVVLDSMSYWRTYQTARPPVAEVDGEVKAFEDPWQEWEKYSPPADWTSPDFDDHGWVQSMIRMTPYDVNMARLCLRGKFSVSDPA